MSANELSRLSTIISTINFDPGRTVIGEGEPASDLFNVVRGSVRLYKLLTDGRRQVTGFLFPGDFLGIALNDTYAYSAEAIEPVQLCRFPRKKLETLLAELPRLERKLLGTTAHELAAAQDQIVLLGRKTAKERVASFPCFALGPCAEAPPARVAARCADDPHRHSGLSRADDRDGQPAP